MLNFVGLLVLLINGFIDMAVSVEFMAVESVLVFFLFFLCFMILLWQFYITAVLVFQFCSDVDGLFSALLEDVTDVDFAELSTVTHPVTCLGRVKVRGIPV